MKLHKEWAKENQVKYLVWRMHWWKLEYDDRYDKFWIDLVVKPIQVKRCPGSFKKKYPEAAAQITSAREIDVTRL